ncbi:MAG: DUF4838 domain-containing protein [Spirochaetaceae bacterium]|nr:DUF4838 domain-containing protein [Spirochaetaceae bacterium]
MIGFDVSKEWIIVSSPDTPAAEKAAEELSRSMGLLRGRAGLSQKAPPIQSAAGKGAESGFSIRLGVRDTDREKNGFSWRFGKERLEIEGESGRGLCNGVFDFLSALGFRWPGPGEEVLPDAGGAKGAEYGLAESYASRPSGPDSVRRRLVFRGEPSPLWKPLVLWAARRQIDTLVFSLRGAALGAEAEGGRLFSKRFAGSLRKCGSSSEELLDLAERYAMTVELGGWDLSFLVPRRYFLFHKDMFRMDAGKRDKRHNFCPTSPESIKILQEEAEKVFRSHPNIGVYHLWPDSGHEKAWCSCPTCRAFTLEEQNRIAVNAAAFALAKVNPGARISFYENPLRKGNIEPRANLFRIHCLPGEAGAEAGGWFVEPRTDGKPGRAGG